jgi:NADH:ubiquinone reductase (H+-translocating)
VARLLDSCVPGRACEDESMAARHRVVILGGGFGGLYAAKAFRGADVDVTLVDRRNHHLFQPLLYQVATGSLGAGEIAAPLRSILNKQANTRVLLDTAISVNTERRELICKDEVLPYDSLIVACGARNFYFGNPWESIAPGLKSIDDATRMRAKLLYAFEAAEREPDPAVRHQWLTFVIVGAGPTGVELAGALAEIAHDTLRHDFKTIHPEEARILLLEGSDRVLPPFPPSLSAAAEKSLVKLGVRPRTGIRVDCIDANGVTIAQTGERIEAKTVLWAAGVAPSEFGAVLEKCAGAKLDRQGRVMVEPDLTIAGHPEIFVIGDMANLTEKGDKAPLPGVAPVAMQQGRYVSQTILKRVRGEPTPPFHYWNKGNLAVIGRASGVADFGKFQFHGAIAWLLWLFVHLMYLAGFRNRLFVFQRWGFQYLTFDRGARLITGDP